MSEDMQAPIPFDIPWRWFILAMVVVLGGFGVAGMGLAAWEDVQSFREMTKTDSLGTVVSESADARARDSLLTKRKWFVYRADSMGLEWKKAARKRNRRTW